MKDACWEQKEAAAGAAAAGAAAPRCCVWDWIKADGALRLQSSQIPFQPCSLIEAGLCSTRQVGKAEAGRASGGAAARIYRESRAQVINR